MVQPVMLLRQAEAEATVVHSSTPVPVSAPRGYAQAEQESAVRSATQHEELTATQEAQVSRFDAGEVLRVTLYMVGLASLANTITGYLEAATSGMLMPFPVKPGTIPGIISSAVLVLNVALIGIGVGLLANRRTMTASIVAANIAGLLVTSLIFAYLHATLPAEAWAASTFSTFGILFWAVTVTATEVAVAHYVVRNFRKEP